MNKSELQSKHIADLHELAAKAGVERYRMLSRAELIEKLADGKPVTRKQPPRQRPAASQPKPAPPAAQPAEAERPKRKRRRRRRWGRRRKELRIHDLLLPAAASRQAIVYAESRAGCTALLREVAAELADASNGPDPIALLVDPTPEELAEWKRDAPRAEIVSAGKAQHAEDALAQARTRAAAEDVIVLVDSLTRFAESFGGADAARDLFDAGASASGSGSLTVVAAIERPA